MITEYSSSIHWVTSTAIVILLVIGIILIVNVLKVHPVNLMLKFIRLLMKLIGHNVGRVERNYSRDVEIGRIGENSLRVKIYKNLNDLTIDLGYKKAGLTPIELGFFVLASSLVLAVMICLLVLSEATFIPIVFPIVLVSIACGLYTKANVAHDNRIDDVIMAENIISNNIDRGVLVAVRDNIESLPISLKSSFTEFVDNIEAKNYYIKDALLILGDNLGSISDDFIQKCITLELEEEAGLVGIFKDVVEVNNIKTELRVSMKHKFEKVVSDFIIGTITIFTFLGGVLFIYPFVRGLYFDTSIGKVVLIIDFLLLVLEFSIITYLRSREI